MSSVASGSQSLLYFQYSPLSFNDMYQSYQVTTIAVNGREGFKDGNAQESMFREPMRLCISNDGKLYVTEYNNNRIRMIYNNQVTTIAGNGQEGFQDGNAQDAMFNFPFGICISNDGKIYVSDSNNHRIRMIYNNQVTTIAGNGQKGCKDGNALEAMFDRPNGICISNDGRIYVSTSDIHGIRMIYNGQVTTISRNGQEVFQDGNAHNTKFSNPWPICCSHDGKLYAIDYDKHTVKMIHNGQVTIIAGNGQEGFQDGNALEAMFFYPTGISCSNDGRIYVADYDNHRIRMIYNGQVTTIAGNGRESFKDGNALKAMFNYPMGICCSKDDKIYVADYSNHRIRMIYNDQKAKISGNQNQIVLQKSAFGFALLLDMQNTFCDSQISFNGVNYHLHSKLANVRCPLIFDESYFGLLQQSNISNKSFEAFVNFLYSNRLTKEHSQTLGTIPIKRIVELIFMFDLFMNCKWILTDLKTSFKEQLIEMLEVEQQGCVRDLTVDLLPLTYNLKELIKARPLKTNTIRTFTEYCYNQLTHELQKRRLTVAQYVPDLQHHLKYDEFASVLQDLMSETSDIEIIEDGPISLFGAALTELSSLAFYKTNICRMENNETKLESSISPQHLDVWTMPDFMIRLYNDDVEYHVHKLILCGRWKYFCQMIDSGSKEVDDNQMTLAYDWDRSRFEKLMKYIYLNEIDGLEDVERLMGN